MMGAKIYRLYLSFLKKYGKPEGQWRLWCKRPKSVTEREEVAIGAILTQRTNWKNVELAMASLKKAKTGSFKSILRLSPKKLGSLIKPCGFYKTKTRYLDNLANFVVDCGGLTRMRKVGLAELRKKLLGLKGVGPETADSILLYALDKPIFVIDEYTRRFVKKYRIASKLSYDYLQNLFQKNLPRNSSLYQDFHALIVLDGKG